MEWRSLLPISLSRPKCRRLSFDVEAVQRYLAHGMSKRISAIHATKLVSPSSGRPCAELPTHSNSTVTSSSPNELTFSLCVTRTTQLLWGRTWETLCVCFQQDKANEYFVVIRILGVTTKARVWSRKEACELKIRVGSHLAHPPTHCYWPTIVNHNNQDLQVSGFRRKLALLYRGIKL